MKKKNLGGALRALFKGNQKHEDFIEALEDLLIEGDIGARTAMEVVEEVEKRAKSLTSREDLLVIVREVLGQYIKSTDLQLIPDSTNVLLFLGVNGVGKTTTLVKMAHYMREERGLESVLVAADTFRAAAIDQLQEHGRRLDLRVVRQNPGADPGAVVYDGIESAHNKSIPLVMVDTAGRMHTKANLIKELQKIDKIIKSKNEAGTYHKLLVMDATTGQNGMQQAEMFHHAVGIDGVVLAKYDSASKGGTVVSICRNLDMPFVFMGTGEKYTDIQPFDKNRFLDILLSDE